MRIVYMGTPHFSAVILEYLVEQHDVVGVFTRPDTVRKRGKELVPSEVKKVALQHDIPVYEYATFKDNDAFDTLVELNPEVVVVAAYSVLLPEKVINLPEFGCLNVHASALPRWRGAAPIERAILSGDESAGVVIMRMEKGLDTGDYAFSRMIEIGNQTAEELTEELANLGASALLCCLEQMKISVPWEVQDEAEVTYAEKILKGELNISPDLSVIAAQRRVQASSESHPSKACIAGKNLTLIKTAFGDESTTEITAGITPGSVRFVQKRLFIGLADGVLEVLEVKPDGKKAMDAKSFAAGVQGIKNDGIEWTGING